MKIDRKPIIKLTIINNKINKNASPDWAFLKASIMITIGNQKAIDWTIDHKNNKKEKQVKKIEKSQEADEATKEVKTIGIKKK